MTLRSGQKLTHHEVLTLLGKGGMGEVYLARDVRLDREVAIKVLPSELADDEERLARFEREAKTLATLNHPNVAQVYEIDQEGELCFIVMELVPGEDLATRLARGPLTVEETVEVCTQIAEGLAVAHEAGIVHRDLKPGNVRITPEGEVKLLDFGLAKPLHPKVGWTDDGSGAAEPDSVQLTEDGLLLGTPTYMSPEQVRGRPIDRRADIWAFGCVLFECLSGVRAFTANSVPEVLAAILESQPAWSFLPAATPPHLRLLLERTLVKDPKKRLRDLGDARWELESGSARFDTVLLDPSLARRAADAEPVGATTNTPTEPRSWGATLVVAVVCVIAGVFIGRGVAEHGAGPGAAVLRFEQLTDLQRRETKPDLAPDGRFVVYTAMDEVGDANVYRQRVGGTLAQNLTPDSPVYDGEARLSPDGERIVFHSERDGGGLFVMGATGESPRKVSDFGHDADWSPDGRRLCFAAEVSANPHVRGMRSTLHVLDLESGEATDLGVPDGMQPRWSPDGRWIVSWGVNDAGHRDLYLVPTDGGAARQLTDDFVTDWCPAWVPGTSDVVFSSDRGGDLNLWRLALDPGSGEPLGPPRPVTNGVGANLAFPDHAAAGERFVFTSNAVDLHTVRLPYDAARGRVTGPPERIARTRLASGPQVSPDGAWLAYHRMTAQEDLFVTRTDGSERRQLTDDAFKDRWPKWISDDRLLFFSDRTGSYQVWSCAPDGSAARQHTAEDTAVIGVFPEPGGRRFAARHLELGIVLFDLDAPLEEQRPEPIAPPPGDAPELVVSGWTHDGGHLLLSHQRVDGHHGYRYDLEAGTYERVTADGQGLTGLHTNDDVVYVTGSGQLMLWDAETGAESVLYATEHEQAKSVSSSPGDAWLYVSLQVVDTDVWLAEPVPTQD